MMLNDVNYFKHEKVVQGPRTQSCNKFFFSDKMESVEPAKRFDETDPYSLNQKF